MNDFSNPKVLEHFKNPRGSKAPLQDYDLVGEYGSPLCGDSLRIWLKLSEDKKKVVDAAFKAFGCISAVASSSALMELVIGMSLEDASKLTAEDVAAVFGGLPESKMHCPEIPLNAMRKALASNGLEVELHPIEMNVQGHSSSFDKKSLSHFEALSKIAGLWIKELKPSLENAGMTPKLISASSSIVIVSLHGDTSEIAGMTPAKWLEKKFQEEVSENIKVKVQD